MLDAHVHLERGPYTLDWVWQFIRQAQHAGLDQIYLLEHSHRFQEFAPLYRWIRSQDPAVNQYQQEWLHRKLQRRLGEYTDLVRAVRQQDLPIRVDFGLEVCYFPQEETLIKKLTSDFDWDFLTGAVHWIDGWGFDHPQTKETWRNRDIDRVYQRYFDLIKQLIQTRLFNHLAHPDSIKCFNHEPGFDLNDTYHDVAKIVKAYDLKVENSAGLHLNYGHAELGLNRQFLAHLQAAGVSLLTASDAHRPEDVGRYIPELAALHQ